MLMLMGTLLLGCSAAPVREVGDLPEQRPSDFTLGVVVFGGENGAAKVPERSARYIIEPGGRLHASFGDGSQAMTYPPITRRLDESQIDLVWAMIRAMGLGDEPWRRVQAPEQHHEALGSGQGYLLELRSGVRFGAWSAPIETPQARALAQRLAELAWIRD